MMGRASFDKDSRGVIPISPTIIIDLEDYLLAKAGILRITRDEVQNLPIKTVQHYLGFIRGQEEREKIQQERILKRKTLSDFARGG